MTDERQLFSRAEARRVDDEAKIMAIPAPEFTTTWHPYSHKDVMIATELAIEKLGLKIQKKMYSISQNGDNVNALLELDIKKEGKIACLGWRNSLDMTWAVGFCGIFTVLFCTNQITRGDYFLLRRHTSLFTIEELSSLAVSAVENVVNQFDSLHIWHESLKEVTLSYSQVTALTVQAMREEVLRPTRFKEFDRLLLAEKHTYEMTLYGFHGALTQLIRDFHLRSVIEDNTSITAFIDKAKARLIQ